MSLKTSADSQFEGTITALQLGAINSEIEITLTGDDRVVAITQGSVRELGLAAGCRAYIVKAPRVIVVADYSPLKFSARNQLRGKVSRVKPGAVADEVAITQPSGTVVHS